MGLILDTSVLIYAERNKATVRTLVAQLQNDLSDEIALSSISVMEFASGVERAITVRQREERIRFLNNVRASLQIIPFDEAIAARAGLLNGAMQSRGVQPGPLDLMIGVTALEVGYSVVTRNARHFRMIPQLNVLEMK